MTSRYCFPSQRGRHISGCCSSISLSAARRCSNFCPSLQSTLHLPWLLRQTLRYLGRSSLRYSRTQSHDAIPTYHRLLQQLKRTIQYRDGQFYCCPEYPECSENCDPSGTTSNISWLSALRLGRDQDAGTLNRIFIYHF